MGEGVLDLLKNAVLDSVIEDRQLQERRTNDSGKLVQTMLAARQRYYEIQVAAESRRPPPPQDIQRAKQKPKILTPATAQFRIGRTYSWA